MDVPSASGYLRTIVPLEILERIWQHLSLPDLVTYRNTSGVNRLQVQDFVRQQINNEIRRFVDDPIALRNALWNTRSIISGSVALASLIPFKTRSWNLKNMDIYTITKYYPVIKNYLIRVEKFTVVSMMERGYTQHPRLGAIQKIVKLTCGRGCEVVINVSDSRSTFTPLLKFYGTHVVNAITGRGILSVYPIHTFARRSLFNTNASTADKTPNAL
jgi:hypothetical protein